MFFFVVAPFCSCPASLVFGNFFAVGPGCAKCFFFVALRWAPRPFGGARAKKKHPRWCFFFCCGPARTLTHSLRAWVAMPPPRRGGACFFAAGRGRTGVVFFFCCGPARTLTHSLWAGAISARPGWCFFFLLRPRRVFLDNNKKCLGYYIGSKKTRRGHSKKNTPLPRCFFLLWPRAGAQQGFSFPCRSRGRSKKKTPWVVFFFLLWPRAGFQRGFSFPCLSRGRSKKKHPGWCFFFCSGPVPAPNGASPSPAFPRGRSKKKKTAWVVFFFLLRPRADAHSLTAGLGGDASPSAGWCFVVAAAPPGPGWCFVFCCGPARTLTHSRWAGAISARPGWCFFFCCGPAGSF